MTTGVNMSLGYNASVSAAYNAICTTSREINKTIDVLSSKFRINSAADDAAGLAISERMRAETAGLARSMSNVQDGLSMLQTAEGGLQDISSIVQKMRELAVRSANDTLTQSDRSVIQAEFSEIRNEIDRISNTTQFNGKKLLNGDTSALWSSSDSGVRVILNGGISEILADGERASAEGNYDVSIKAKAGQAEVQKTGIFQLHTESEVNEFTGVEGSGVYYDSNGIEIPMSAAIYNLGLSSWIDPVPGTRDGTTFEFFLVNTDTNQRTEVRTTIYSSDFTTPQGFVDFLNSETDRTNNSTLYGTGYEAYYNKSTGKLGIRSSHGFKIDDSVGGFQRLFGYVDTSTSSTSSSTSTNSTSGTSSSTVTTNSLPRAARSAMSAPARLSALPPNVGAGTNITYGSGTYTISGSSTENVYILDGSSVTLNLNGARINGNINVGSGVNLTLKLSGNTRLGTTYSSDYQGVVALGSGSTLTIEDNGNNGTIRGRISSAGGNTITINSGTVIANSRTSYHAGIQVGPDSTLEINGGSVTARGGIEAAAIGGDDGQSGGTITINGGTVTVQGGQDAAGIGGGRASASGGTITINNGTVTASGGTLAAAIGNGREGASGGTITINNGTVTANGGTQAAGIGGGYIASATGRTTSGVLSDSGNITINGGTVTATGGSGSGYSGAGIGGGRHMNGGTITITDGTVIATSAAATAGNGAGIGGGSGGSGGTITISGGNVTAVSEGVRGAGIGSGSSRGNSHANAGTITISGGTVSATGGEYGAGIGTGQDAEGGTVNISGGYITAQGGSHGSGIGTGYIETNPGTQTGLNITISSGDIRAKGGTNGAGIGGGENGEGGNITISGGKIEATSGGGGAASIGGGINGDRGTLTINGGLFYDDNTGMTKVFNEDNTIGRIGAGTTVIYSNDVIAFSGNVTEYTPESYEALGNVTLQQLENFYDSEGKFVFDTPQKLTITQGDGQTASLTLYASDSLDEIAGKINDAIANDLGQSKYLSGDIYEDHFATFITDSDALPNTSESVAGTIVIRSAIAGSAGTLKFSGAEELLKTLGLNTIQEAEESEFEISIRDAHTNKTLNTSLKTTGGYLVGAISPNVDLKFDAMTGIYAGWSDTERKFTFAETTHDAVIHLSDNSMNLQAGAKEGERINVSIGEVSTESLNLNELDVSSRESAAESISAIDTALDKVSAQSAKVGALISRMERTLSVMSVMHENVTSSESKIRDADVAKETMHLTKLQILLNAQTSVMAQANQNSNNVLSLLR